jgi:hypothetical protein
LDDHLVDEDTLMKVMGITQPVSALITGVIGLPGIVSARSLKAGSTLIAFIASVPRFECIA